MHHEVDAGEEMSESSSEILLRFFLRNFSVADPYAPVTYRYLVPTLQVGHGPTRRRESDA